MDTTDVSALTRRIQELEKENARLKAILEKNGIEYENLESTTCNPNYVEVPCVSNRQFTIQEKVAIFQNAFQGRDDVFAKRWYSCTTQNPATNQYVRENGIVTIVTNANTNAQIVPTGSSLL